MEFITGVRSRCIHDGGAQQIAGHVLMKADQVVGAHVVLVITGGKCSTVQGGQQLDAITERVRQERVRLPDGIAQCIEPRGEAAGAAHRHFPVGVQKEVLARTPLFREQHMPWSDILCGKGNAEQEEGQADTGMVLMHGVRWCA